MSTAGGADMMRHKITHIAEGLRRGWKRKGYDPRRYDFDAAVERAKLRRASLVRARQQQAVQARHRETGCPPAELVLVNGRRQKWIECPVCGWGTDGECFARWHPERYAAIIATRGEPLTWPKRRPRHQKEICLVPKKPEGKRE